MVSHHPPDEYLVQYAAGVLPEGSALVIAGHLNFCPSCREIVRDAELIGGLLLEQVPERSAVPMPSDLPSPAEPVGAVQPAAEATSDVPYPLRYAIGNRLKDISWFTFWPGMQMRKVRTATPGSDLRLFRIRPGKGLPIHTHQGDELTLVLEGSFTDSTGHYTVGDFAIANEALTHHPLTEGQAPCICLASVEAPLLFKYWRARVAARLLSY